MLWDITISTICFSILLFECARVHYQMRTGAQDKVAHRPGNYTLN